MKLFKKPTIVRMGNYYAIEKVIFGFRLYRDLESRQFWWSRRDPWFSECITQDTEKVQRIYSIHHGKIQDV